MRFRPLVFITGTLVYLSVASLSPKSPTQCPITLDGRVPHSFTLQIFDTPASLFNPNYTKGENLTWSQILLFPGSQPSKFDTPAHKTVEVTISDESIFVPGGGTPQLGFRRAGLLLGNGSDASNMGVQTYHWSVKQDLARKMNLTHEFINVWHETNDFSANQFSFNTGIMLEQDHPLNSNISTTDLDKRLWKFLNRDNDVVWTTWIEWGEWQNFAVTLDYEDNTFKIYYSTGSDNLKAVTKSLKNDNSGGGQFQIGMAKKPTETITVVYDGYQEPNLNEGQIYGGIFIEDSSGGCISR